MYLLEMLISFATPTDLSFFILGLNMFKYVNKFVETNSQSTTILDKYLNLIDATFTTLKGMGPEDEKTFKLEFQKEGGLDIIEDIQNSASN